MRTLGHQDTGTSGHWDTRTLGQWDTEAMQWDTGIMDGVGVPTYSNRVVIYVVSHFSLIYLNCE